MVYETSWEHLADELRLVDLLLRRQVLAQKGRQSTNPLDQFRGLVLSDEEVAGLLDDEGASPAERDSASPPDAQAQLLSESIRRRATQLQERRAASISQGRYLPLEHLAQLFQLTTLEEKCLILCLAPELDRKYEKLFAYLQDDVTRKSPCVDLVLSLLCASPAERLLARLSFDARAPLLKYRLLNAGDGASEQPTTLLSQPLTIDERVVNFLLGFNQPDGRLEQFVQVAQPAAAIEPSPGGGEICGRILKLLDAHFNGEQSCGQKLVFYFHGPDGAGKQTLTRAVCRDFDLPLVFVGEAGKLLTAPRPFDETLCLLGRETVLQSAALCLDGFDALLVGDEQHRAQLSGLGAMLTTFPRVTFLLGTQQWNPQGLFGEHLFIPVDFPLPNEQAREHHWAERLTQAGRPELVAEAGALASKFRFTPGQIRAAVTTAQQAVRWRAPDDPRLTVDDLYTACRRQSAPKLGQLACKIEPKYGWPDLVLPPDQLSQIKDICHQVQHRHTVYGAWGFENKLSLGKGLNALFSGPPGTGKTMTAEVISNELRLDLYKIDLSQVVSKYIGETEKNLHRLFLEARTSNAILFFDEADALFGKRSEVKDAHDRYANIEIGYLLQKMEEYDGIAILATNLRQHLDEAFVRRMHVVVEFPFPDEEQRRRIWEVAFPAAAPLGDDVDFQSLAREIQLAGGNIKNIALAAAFAAARDGGVIRRWHLAAAAGREYQKLGRTWSTSEQAAAETLIH